MSSAKIGAATKFDGVKSGADKAAAASSSASASGSRAAHRPRRPGRPSESRSEGRFLPYLPHEDAVAAGREGALDVSVSQEVADLLNAELSTLLRLKPQQFWKQVTTDESLRKYLDTYLQFRRRWYEYVPAHYGTPPGILIGDNDLFQRTFKVFYRMSSFHDSHAPSPDSSQAKEPARMLFDKGLLDVPKLMDICAIYDHDNPDLTHRLVNNVLRAVPNVAEEISAIVPPLVHTVDIMHRRCRDAVQELSLPASSPPTLNYANIRQQLVEVLDYLTDVVATISAFIHAYPSAASILATFAAPSNVQGPFLPFIAGIHDSLVPLLSKGLSATAVHIDHKRLSKDYVELRFKRLRIQLINLAWEIVRITYLAKFDGGSSSSVSGNDREIVQVQRLGVQGDFVIQAVVAIALGVEDKENFSFGSAGGLLKLDCTGSMLRAIEKKYGLCEVLRRLCHSGALVLDDAQYEYLAALATKEEAGSSDKAKRVAVSMKLSSESMKCDEDEALNAATLSKVQEVRDIFPAFGTGFILACLEVYDNNPEKVIESVLEGTLYPDLAALETWLEKKPVRSTSASSGKDKGKRIVTDESPPTKAKKALALEGASSSSQVFPEGDFLPPSFPPETHEEQVAKEAWPSAVESSSTSTSTATGTRLESIGALDRAVALTGAEYDDEYDDSFDDLGTYPGDSGVEETGNLDDVIANVLPPSGSSSGLGWRRSETGASRGLLGNASSRGGNDRKSKPDIHLDTTENWRGPGYPADMVTDGQVDDPPVTRVNRGASRRTQQPILRYQVKELGTTHPVALGSGSRVEPVPVSEAMLDGTSRSASAGDDDGSGLVESNNGDDEKQELPAADGVSEGKLETRRFSGRGRGRGRGECNRRRKEYVKKDLS